MKRVCGFLGLAWLLSMAPLYSDDTAYQALKVISSAKGQDSMKNLVEIMGESGSPQPDRWTMLFNDPSARGGVREIVVEDKAISSERTPLRGFAGVGDMPVIKASDLNTDSDKAFHIAEEEAIKSKVGFHHMDYTLRVGTDSNVPFWSIRLYNKMGATVGQMEIATSNGEVIKHLTVDPDYQNSASDSGSDSSDSSDEDSSLRQKWREGGGLVGKVEDVTKRTGNTIKKTTLRVGGSIQEFFTGERTIDEDNNDR